MSFRNPQEGKLASRIKQHLEKKLSNEKVIFMWQGYLAGLFEWSKIDFKTYEHLDSMLSNIVPEEISELLFEPDWIENSELDDEDCYRKINNSNVT